MKRAHHNPYNSHQEISLLLPWFVNKTLSGAERIRVENHLKVCLTCRREIAGLIKLSEAVQQDGSLDSAVQASFSQLRKRIELTAPDVQEVMPPTVNLPVRRKWTDKPVLKHLAMEPQALALAAVLILSLLVNGYFYTGKMLNNDYRTLSDTTTSIAGKNDIKVVFADKTDQQQLNKILTSVHGQIVEGPSAQGVYTVRIEEKFAAANLLETITQLRENPNVIFAEPAAPSLSSLSAEGIKQ